MSTILSANPEDEQLGKGVFIYESIILGQYVVEFSSEFGQLDAKPNMSESEAD